MINRQNLPYREGVIGYIFDNKKRFLIVQMKSYKDNEWRLPGGGTDGEDPLNAISREISEELGIDFEVKIIGVASNKTCFDWPDKLIQEHIDQKKTVYRGQKQTQVLMKYLGGQINLDPNEIKQYKWVYEYELPQFLIFVGQMAQTIEALNEFKEMKWI